MITPQKLVEELINEGANVSVSVSGDVEDVNAALKNLGKGARKPKKDAEPKDDDLDGDDEPEAPSPAVTGLIGGPKEA